MTTDIDTAIAKLEGLAPRFVAMSADDARAFFGSSFRYDDEDHPEDGGAWLLPNGEREPWEVESAEHGGNTLLIDTQTRTVIGGDGGEPEDQRLYRDWKWVPVALNALDADLRAARDQLRAAEERAMRAEKALAATWQPIETAPKDGTRVLLWITRDDHDVAPREAARDGSFYAPDQTWVSHGDYVMATHWQPLPAPPALSETT